MDPPFHGDRSADLPSTSPFPQLPGSRDNPIDLTSAPPAAPPVQRRDYVDLSISPLSAASTPASYTHLPRFSRARSNTQGRYHRQSPFNSPAHGYEPNRQPSTPSRPHSVSFPSPIVNPAASALLPGSQRAAYPPEHIETDVRPANPTFGMGDTSRWEPPGWVEPLLSGPARTFNELLFPGGTTLQGQSGGSPAARRALWQPDDDVTACTRCSREFGLLFRRHHCRKCGLVVCAPCSTHRISMPRKYIAQPAEYDTEGELENGDELQTVRVCDPCVPDPNWGPPPQLPHPQSPQQVPLQRPSFPPRLSDRTAGERSQRIVRSLSENPVPGLSTQSERPLPLRPEPATPNPARHYHRMATYMASEKDVRSHNDELQECVICLEEFEVGEELALLECFCKFHKSCIVGWWEKDAAGSCPTHKLRE